MALPLALPLPLALQLLGLAVLAVAWWGDLHGER